MDIFGRALSDFYNSNQANYTDNQAETLWLHNSYDEPEEMPVAVFFRSAEEMPELEHQALALCRGKVLDVGAGVGSHALILQEKGIDVTAIDISAEAVKIMQQRGVKKAFVHNIFTLKERYDTLLFLMNGIGLTGTLKGLETFLQQAKTLIHPGGQLLFDSSDISYLYEDLPRPKQHYFGEIQYRYVYKNQQGEWFNWLYIDPQMLRHIAKQTGWQCDLIYEDDADQYLARLY